MILVKNNIQTITVPTYRRYNLGVPFLHLYSKTTNAHYSLVLDGNAIRDNYIRATGVDFSTIPTGEYDYLIADTDADNIFGKGLLEVRKSNAAGSSYSFDVLRQTPEFQAEYVNLTLLGDNCQFVGEGTYFKNTEKVIIAIPDAGYAFYSWSDGNTEAKRTITIENDTTLTATLVNSEELEEEVAELEEQVTNLNQQIETLNETIAEKEATIAEKNQEIATKTQQIAELEEQKTALEGEVATLQGQVATLQGQVSVLQGQVATLQGQVETLTAEKTALEGQVATLQGQVATLQGQVEYMSKTEEMSITSNGVYNPSEGHYAISKVTVDVAGGELQEKDVIVDGESVIFTDTLNVTDNGTYLGIYDRVNVNVDQHETEIAELEEEVVNLQTEVENQKETIAEQTATITDMEGVITEQAQEIATKSNVGEITITANGTYEASAAGKYAYTKVIVNEDNGDNLQKYIDGSIITDDGYLDLSAYPTIGDFLKFDTIYTDYYNKPSYLKLKLSPYFTDLKTNIVNIEHIENPENIEYLGVHSAGSYSTGSIHINQKEESPKMNFTNMKEFYVYHLCIYDILFGEDIEKFNSSWAIEYYGTLTFLGDQMPEFSTRNLYKYGNAKLICHYWFDKLGVFQDVPTEYLEQATFDSYIGEESFELDGVLNTIQLPVKWTLEDGTTHTANYKRNIIVRPPSTGSQTIDYNVTFPHDNQQTVQLKSDALEFEGSQYDLYGRFVFSISYYIYYDTSFCDEMYVDGQLITENVTVQPGEHTIGYKIKEGVTSGWADRLFSNYYSVYKEYIYVNWGFNTYEYMWMQQSKNGGYKCDVVIDNADFVGGFEEHYVNGMYITKSMNNQCNFLFNGAEYEVPVYIFQDSSNLDSFVQYYRYYSNKPIFYLTETQYNRVHQDEQQDLNLKKFDYEL